MDKSIKLILYSSLVFFCFKIFSIYFTNLGLYGDEAQYWLWSKDLSFGYFSKPPLLPYLMRGFSVFFGNTIFGIKLLSIILYLLSTYVVFLISKKINKGGSPIVIALTFFLLPGVSFSSFIVSTDVPLLLFWSLSLYFLLAGFKNPNLKNSFFLGVAIGLGFLSKYAMIYFVLCFFIFMFFEKSFYQSVRENLLLYLMSLIIVLILIFPNIYWNLNNNWLTFSHTVANVNLSGSFELKKFFEFLLAQIFIIGPIMFVLSLIYFIRFYNNNQNSKFLLSFSLPVLLIVFIESILVRAHGNWAAVSYVSLTILIANGLNVFLQRSLLVSNLFNLATGFLFFGLIIIGPNFSVFNQLKGYQEYSDKIVSLAKTNGLTNIVIQDRMLFSLTSYFINDKKFEILTPRSPKQLITNHFQINSSLSSGFKDSFLYIGNLGTLSYLERSNESSLINEIKINSKINNVKIYKITIN